MKRIFYVVILFCLVVSCNGKQEEQLYVSRYKSVFTKAPVHVPTSKTPDAPLAGNGDLGIVMGGTPDRLCFYIGKNDFWRAYPVYPGGGIAFPGGLDIIIGQLEGADYYAEDVPDKAYIRGAFMKNDLQVDLKAWVAAENNKIIIELLSNQDCDINLRLWTPEGNTSIIDGGRSGDVIWVSRSFENTALLEWESHIALALKALGKEISSEGDLTLSPGQPVILTLTVNSNFDAESWLDQTLSEAKAITIPEVDSIRNVHVDHWKAFWNKSQVQIGDSILESYYYISQYLLASSTRSDKFAPGIWGVYIMKDSAAWGGDYHLNYNYQAPFWACYSSNHIDLLESFDQPLLDYMDKGKEHAKELLNCRGIYYPVGIGPRGLCTTRWPLTPDEMEQRYGTRENTIDQGYKFLGQKINAVFSVGNMLMRFYSTYDGDYAGKVYPYMLACADFWEDYLSFEDNRYVIRMDHYGEVMPNLRNKGQWRDRLGDVNSTLSLGLVRMLFKGMLDVSGHLNTDNDRREKWQHILTHLSDYPLAEVDGRKALKSVEEGKGWSGSSTGLARVSIHGLILPGGVCGPVSTPELNNILWSDVDHWKDRSEKAGSWGNTFGNGVETVFPGAVRVGYDPDFILEKLKERIAAGSYANGWIVAEGGGIETLSAVPMTINEMMMQSYEHVVRIFPVWNKTKDASFQNLRAYGAFLISSSVKNGIIESVHLLSEKGRTCKMENPWKGNVVQLIRSGESAEQVSGDIFEFGTSPGETIELKLCCN